MSFDNKDMHGFMNPDLFYVSFFFTGMFFSTAWITMVVASSNNICSIPAPRVVLDVGCGTGWSTFQLSQQKELKRSIIVGVDPNPKSLITASQFVKTDPRVFFIKSTFQEFTRICRPASIDYIKMYYCLSDRSFPSVDDIIDDIDRVLHPDGVLDIQDYSRRFIASELSEDETIDPLFHWPDLEKAFSCYSCMFIDYPTLSSKRMVFQKK